MNIKLSQTGRRLSVLVGILTTMIASGCTPPDTAGLVAGTKKAADHTLTITFVNGCPTKVERTSEPTCEPPDDVKLHADVTPPADLVCAKRGEAIKWVSDPVGTRFQIYFDPFVGRPYASHPPDHETRAFRVNNESMKGKYKYSVLGLDCTDGNPVLDPPIRVEF